MGYNRSGRRRTERLKRHRKEERRLAAKGAGEDKGLGQKVKDMAHTVAEKVRDAAHAVADKVTGKGK